MVNKKLYIKTKIILKSMKKNNAMYSIKFCYFYISTWVVLKLSFLILTATGTKKNLI